MTLNPNLYIWLYDHMVCRYYDILMKWCFLPLGGEDKARRALVDTVDMNEGDKILDMCCGTGNTTFVLASKAGKHSEIQGIDISSGQIRIAKKKNFLPNVEFMVMEASDTCFSDGYFDRVLIPHALHEMPGEKRLAVLREARRIVKDGGALAVFEMDTPPSLFRHIWVGFWWFYWLPFNPETRTRRDMLKSGLAEEINKAGFRNVRKISLYHGTLQVVQGQK